LLSSDSHSSEHTLSPIIPQSPINPYQPLNVVHPYSPFPMTNGSSHSEPDEVIAEKVQESATNLENLHKLYHDKQSA